MALRAVDPAVEDIRQKFSTLEGEMRAKFYESEDEIRGLMVGLIARLHVLFVGPPGTGKSELTETLCQSVSGRYFRTVLSRTSAPEQVFGPVSLRALEQDSFRRVTTGRFPEAHIDFFDEVWKCNSAVLNMLLPGLNERIFEQDGKQEPIPLQMAVGASNELPEDREELGALWDRFSLRYMVSYIKQPTNFEAMLLRGDVQVQTIISLDELAAAQAAARQVRVDGIVPTILALRQKLAEMNVPVSDRRWKQNLRLLQANAWLDGRDSVDDADLEILVPACWEEPGQIPQVRQTILQLANPLDAQARAIIDDAEDVFRTTMATVSDPDAQKVTKAGMEANAKFRTAAKTLQTLAEQAQREGRNDARIVDALAKVKAWNTEVSKACLGL